MKFLHTADWHLGQLFHEYDRTYEHQQFFKWLVQTLFDEKIDVLLISGDVFDLSNPSAASVKLFYSFLNQATKACPEIIIIVTAGNHDSASRLESPKPLLESSNIHIIGLVEKNAEGTIDYEKLIIPIKGNSGLIDAWCMAIPFLRMGDYPTIHDCERPYMEGITAFYKEMYAQVNSKKQENQAIIAMGHLHALNAEITDLDKTERLIMGGIEFIPVTTFDENINYVALGHIHKAQRIGGKDHVRYSGSPIPMSFSELNYKHQVVIFETEAGNVSAIRTLEVPLSVALQALPLTHQPLIDVLAVLGKIPNANSNDILSPYLEVRVLLDGPEPALRHKIEKVLVGKDIRLAKIDVKYGGAKPSIDNTSAATIDKLEELKPSELFAKAYQSKYDKDVPQEMLNLFNIVLQELSLKEY